MRIQGIVQRGRRVTIAVDGRDIEAYEGETVASALLANGIRSLRSSAKGESRGMFCAIGICQECVVEIDGMTVAACRLPVRDRMQIQLRRFTDEEH
jgi:predicted molibdopterin-dependent oxidoreductase YjgC